MRKTLYSVLIPLKEILDREDPYETIRSKIMNCESLWIEQNSNFAGKSYRAIFTTMNDELPIIKIDGYYRLYLEFDFTYDENFLGCLAYETACNIPKIKAYASDLEHNNNEKGWMKLHPSKENKVLEST